MMRETRRAAFGESMAGARRKAALMAKKTFAALMVSSPIGLASCVDCPVDEMCNTNDYDITLKEGETKSTMSRGQEVHVEVLDITQHVEDTGMGFCEVTGGSARLKLTIVPPEGSEEPAYEQELSVSPSMCFAVANRCVSISDAEITQDVGEPTGGQSESDAGVVTASTCPISNEKVQFTLTIGE